MRFIFWSALAGIMLSSFNIVVGDQTISGAATSTTVPIDPVRPAAVANDEVLRHLTEATVRIRTGNACGSGTIVGRDSDGRALVLTNAHVAGTKTGSSVQLERWSYQGDKETGNGVIVGASYGRGINIDFAILKCNESFASEARSIPLLDRYPNSDAMAVTFGCPRCEWPSLQTLKWNQQQGHVLTWAPEAIAGRSGSGVFEITDEGPRLVALLTWGGNGQGLGQSSPYLLQVMRGQIPKSVPSLPDGVEEMGTLPSSFVSTDSNNNLLSSTRPSDVTSAEDEGQMKSQLKPLSPQLIDAITSVDDRNGWWFRNRAPQQQPGLITRGLDTLQRVFAAIGLLTVGLVAGYLVSRWYRV